MTALPRLLSTPFAQALSAALLHFVWEGAAIASLLAVLLYLCRRSSASLRYALACFAMLLMITSFAATFAVSWIAASGPSFASALDSTAVHRAPPVPLRFDALPPRVEQQLPWIVPVWIAGVCALALRSILSGLGARRLRITAVSPAPDPWQQKLGELGARIRCSEPVLLLESCLAEAPSVIGWLKPVILIPAGMLAGFPADQIELILIHELAHIRRRDYLVNLMQTAAEDLLFYHPAVWWVSNRIRIERENCCDDVVREIGDARSFAAALVALEESRWSAPEVVLSARGGHLMNRIKRLIGAAETPHTGAAPALLATLLLVGLLASGAGVSRRVPVAQVRTSPTFATAFDQWVNYDVGYIISDEERSAFQRLQSDEERQKFIEQFWERRDPTPGTPKNEMREEHYRRLAYADERFTDRGTQGWQTDRGHIYISFGPPDEIDDHTTSGAVPPYVVWAYRYIEGLGTNVMFTFVDDGTGIHVASIKGIPGVGAPSRFAPQFLEDLRRRLNQ